MLRKRGTLYGMTVLFLLLAGFLCTETLQKEMISFQVFSGGDFRSITLREQEDGCFYVFLPSYAGLEDVKVVLHTDSPVRINGMELENGMVCTPFSEGVTHTLSYTAWGRHRQKEIIFLRSANIAAMYIDTQSGSMDSIHGGKGNKESGTLTLYLSDGTIAYSGELESIQGRGNSTWTSHEKKPYSIHLMDEADLLGMGSAQNWVLLANAKDRSHLRNKVIYDFADLVGMRYTPDADWVDLYLNGEYAGLYLLSERNEVHPERVDISEADSSLVSLEMRDRIIAQNYPHVSTAADQYLRVHYPQNLSVSRKQELEAIWQSIENAILAENDRDPVTGRTWMELIDLDSWVKKYLLEEIFGNIDACFISQYFYCDGSDAERKVYAGPVWDYDQSMGLESAWQLSFPNTLYGNRYAVNAEGNTPWFYCLYQKEIFYAKMVTIYRKDFLPLLNGFLDEHIQACSKRIAQAYVLDQIRWDLGDTDLQEKAEYLQNFMRERTAFLNSVWLEKRQYYMVKANNPLGGNNGYFAIVPGERFTGLPEFESIATWEFLGWYDLETGEPFSSSEPIHQDGSVYAKWKRRPVLILIQISKLLPSFMLVSMFCILLFTDVKRTGMTYFRN